MQQSHAQDVFCPFPAVREGECHGEVSALQINVSKKVHAVREGKRKEHTKMSEQVRTCQRYF